MASTERLVTLFGFALGKAERGSVEITEIERPHSLSGNRNPQAVQGHVIYPPSCSHSLQFL